MSGLEAGHPTAAELEQCVANPEAPALAAVRAHAETCASCAMAVFRLRSAHADTGNATGSITSPSPVDRGERVLPPGTAVGRYAIVAKVGQGGMGVVYAAHDPELDRKVALKLLSARGGEQLDPEQMERLTREARAMARLTHPNVLPVHDVGVAPPHGPFIAMELVEGQNLRSWLREGHGWRERLLALRAAGAGLAAAHAIGVIHRDFKPDNILIGKDGHVRLMDFGLADRSAEPKAAEGMEPAGAAEKPRTVEGTPGYLAPEQLEGAPADVLTDQFSFGVALHEALFGQRPFLGHPLSRPQGLRWKMLEPGRSNVPASVRRVIARTLSVEPRARFPSLQDALDELAKDPFAARRRAALGVGLLMLLGAVGFTVRAALHQRAALCSGATERLAGIWDANTQGELARALTGEGGARRQDAWEKTSQTLGRYAQAWTQMRTDACRATRTRGEQSEEVYGLRTACLDARLQEMQSLTSLLTHADERMTLDAPVAAASLTPVAVCADVPRLRARVPLPESASARAAIASAQKQLSDAQALLDTGQVQPSLALVQQVLGAMGPDGYAPTLAQAHLLESRGRKEQLSPAAVDAAMSALTYAYAAQDTRAFDAALSMGMLLVFDLKQDLESSVFFRLGQAAVKRSDATEELKLDMAMEEAFVDRKHERYEAANAKARRVLALAESMPPGNEVLQTAAYQQLGALLDGADVAAEAERAARLSAQTRRKVFGELATQTGYAYNNLSAVLTDSGKLAEAREAAAKAVEIFHFSLRDQPAYGFVLINLGEAEQQLGELDLAHAHFEEAVAKLTHALGAGNGYTLMAANDLASVELARDPQKALPRYQENLAAAQRSLPARDADRVRAQVGVLACRGLSSSAEAKKAVAGLRAALATQHATHSGTSEYEAAVTTFLLARVLAVADPADSEARAQAEKAVRQFDAIHRVYQRDAARAWVAQLQAR